MNEVRMIVTDAKHLSMGGKTREGEKEVGVGVDCPVEETMEKESGQKALLATSDELAKLRD